MKVYYLGQFPPPYGGVTVKNALLAEALADRVPVEKVGFRDEGIVKIIRLLMTSKDGLFVLGFGNARMQRTLLCLLSIVRPSVLSRCYLMAMGGLLPSHLSSDLAYRKACAKLGRVYVETKTMCNAARNLGLDNVSIYPNCRNRPTAAVLPHKTGSVLKCVSFSLIGPAKGADVILDCAERLAGVEFYFYGRVEETFKDTFEARVSALPNVFYHGVFDSVANDAVSELSMYDLHLFPSKWAAEGVPGVLVETKMAAVPTVASNINYNAELVESGKDGIVLDECTVEAMCDAIKALDRDRELLASMKEAALASAEYFCVDHYLEELVADLENGRKGALR